MMKQIISIVGVFLIAFVAFIGFWFAMFILANHLGFDSQVTPQYGFTSGIGPMLLTAIGLSTLITGAWHSMNCHEEGCFMIGRHRINGTPWCNKHHHAARGKETEIDLLRKIAKLLEESR